MDNQRFAGFVTMVGTLILAGCSRDRPPTEPRAEVRETSDGVASAPTTSEGEAPPVVDRPARSAADSIADSRCQRELRCDNVGVDRKYSSVDDCVARVKAEWQEDLSARECPGGINQMQLDECLDKVRTEECSAPFDTLARVAACTTGQICEG